MQANVLAEAVCAFHSSAGNLMLHCKAGHNHLTVFRPEEVLNSNVTAGKQVEAEASDLQLKDNVVELHRSLFWVTKCEIEEVRRRGVVRHEAHLQGFSLSGIKLETALSPLFGGPEESRLKVRLFAGDYLVRYRCAADLQISPPREMMLERMVMDPTRRDSGTYAFCKPLKVHLMPVNEDQDNAVKSLSHRVEIIHGPPGTGKSTTIFHVLSARMPDGAASVVTCVTNQAIDAVAEKLSITHEENGGLRILVLGNPKRVGKTAGKYTLDSLCERDALVVSMRWAYNLLRRVLQAAEDLQLARQQRLWKPHKRSRFGLHYIEGLRSVQKYRLELEQDNLQRRRQYLPEENYDPLKFYLDKLNSTKQKMAWAVVRNRALRLPVKRSSFGIRPSWQVEVFCERLRTCFKSAQQALRIAQDTAPARVVRTTRVFLCTIPSSYQARPSVEIVLITQEVHVTGDTAESLHPTKLWPKITNHHRIALNVILVR